MKRQFIKIVGGLMVISTLATSCKKYLDINKNPNAAENVDPKLLFSNAAVSFVNNRSGGDLYIPIALAGQAVASGGNNPSSWGTPTEEQYDINATSIGNMWRADYTYAGVNLKEVIKLAENGSPKNNNAAAQAKVLLGFVFEDLTTLYGDVPFTEALNTDIIYPKFDPQAVVLDGIVKLCDEALAQFDEASPLKISDYDLFYKGDIAKWKRVARSLKLRTLMIMVDKDPSKAAAIGQMITQGGLLSSAADNFLVAYYNTAGRYNPKYGLNKQYNSEESFFGASKWVVNFLNPTNDPRLGIWYEKPASAATYVAPEPGEDIDDNTQSRVNRNFHSANEPEVLFSYQEELFFEAEIYARGLGVPVDMAKATTLYKKAVQESITFYANQAKSATLITSGAANTAIANAFTAAANNALANAASYAASLPDLATLGTNRAAVKYIHYQHWVDEWDRGLDAFTQWRRSGPDGDEVPPLTLPNGAPAGGLFRRYEYPVTAEIAANPNAPKEKIRYDAKMWFDL